MHPQIIHAQTAKALWCEGNTTFYLTFDSNTYNVGDSYEGETITNVYSINGNTQYTASTIPWASIRGSVTCIVVNSNFSNFKPKYLNYWFGFFRIATTFTGLNYINTSTTINMRNLFDSCKGLSSLDELRNWDVQKVTSMERIFASCENLTSLDELENWNTKSVTNLNNAFYNCIKLTSLEPLRNWNTSNLQQMSATFHGCSKLTSLDGLENWTTNNVTNMGSSFKMSGVTSIDALSNWNTSKVTDMSSLFSDCANLTSLEPLRNWTTTNVTNMSSIFHTCGSLTSLEPIKNWDTGKVTNVGSAFYHCTKLTLVELCWHINKVTNIRSFFEGCQNLRGVTFSNHVHSNNITYADNMFFYCNRLRYIDFSNAGSYGGTMFNAVDRSAGVFNGVPETTVIFLPTNGVTDVTNVVYPLGGNQPVFRCPKYYSIDKVDIEFPHTFNTNEAVYSRTMGNKEYGSVVLPYEFTTNSDIQAYSLSRENKNPLILTFTDVQTVPAHTPFAFKRLNNAEFLMKDDNGNFGITVHATRSTNAAEQTWSDAGPITAYGSSYEGSTGLSNWKTKGYYVKETVTDYDGMYFIQNSEFKRATGNLNLVDHRVLFYPTDVTGASKFFTLSFSDDEVVTAIEAAETEQALRQAAGIYDTTGRRQTTAHRGLNIVRMSDGTVRKVLVK